MWDVFDFFHFVSQSITSDGTVSAEVVSAGPANYDDRVAEVGRDAAQTTDPQSPYYGVFVTPQHGLAVQWRSTQAGTTSQVLAPGPSPEYPVYLMIGRWTDPHPGGLTYYTGYWSTDNRTFTAIPGSTVALSVCLPRCIAGDGRRFVQREDDVPGGLQQLRDLQRYRADPAGRVPDTGQRVCRHRRGNSSGRAVAHHDGTVTNLTVNAGGGDIWSTADQFHLCGRTSPVTAGSARESPHRRTPAVGQGGRDAARVDRPGRAVLRLLRHPEQRPRPAVAHHAGAATQQSSSDRDRAGVPQGVALHRRQRQEWYAAFTSTNGTAWTCVAGSTQQFTIAAPLLAGWAANSYSQTTSTTVVFNNIATSTASPHRPAAVRPRGPAQTSARRHRRAARTSPPRRGRCRAEAATSGTGDQFHFVSQPASGDGTISARSPRSRTPMPGPRPGVMMRGTLGSRGPRTTPSSSRRATGWRCSGARPRVARPAASPVPGTVPVYLEVSRWTDSSGTTPVTYYSALTSPDGATWTTVPGSVVAWRCRPTTSKGSL